MKVEIFVLCDAATDYQGKLNILGTFDSLWSRQAPAVHPLCAIALRMRFQKIEEGGHVVRISIIDEDGKPVIKPVEANISIQFQNTSPSSLSTNMILNLQRLNFPHYGEYSIDLAVDGRHEASLPLYVHEIPGQAPS